MSSESLPSEREEEKASWREKLLSRFRTSPSSPSPDAIQKKKINIKKMMGEQGFYIGFVKNVDLVNEMYILKLMEKLLKGQQTMENKETLFNGLLMEDYFVKKSADTENNELKRKINDAYAKYMNTEASKRKEEWQMSKINTKIKANEPNELIVRLDQELSIEGEGNWKEQKINQKLKPNEVERLNELYDGAYKAEFDELKEKGKAGGKKRKSRKQKKSKRNSHKARKSHKRRR